MARKGKGKGGKALRGHPSPATAETAAAVTAAEEAKAAAETHDAAENASGAVAIDAITIAQGLDLMSEKRNATRIKGLNKMIAAMQVKVQEDELSASLHTALNACLTSIRRGKTQELELASNALALIGLTMGADQEKIVTEATEPLNKALAAPAAGVAHAAALRALTTIVFICSNETSTCEAVAARCWKLIQAPKVAPALRTQALAAFAFLATIRSQSQLYEEMDELLPPLVAMLEHPHVSVRTAAGYCIMQLHEIKWIEEAALAKAAEEAAALAGDDEDAGAAGAETKAGDNDGGAGAGAGAGAVTGRTRGASVWEDDDDDDEDYDWDEEEDDDAGGDDAGSDEEDSGEESDEDLEAGAEWVWYDVLGWDAPTGAAGEPYNATPEQLEELNETLHQVMRKLSKDNARHRSKRDKREQRADFRDLYRGMQGGFVPETAVRIRTSSASLVGWTARVQYNYLRDVCASGFQTHLEFNDVVREVLGLTGTVARSAARMSYLQKRMHFSPNSAATKSRQSSRAAKRFTKTVANNMEFGQE